jgi:hypothetical protein
MALSIFDYFDPLIFMVALCVGLIYTYVVTPHPQVIIKYPTPFNLNQIKYEDSAGTCYQYRIKETSCPTDQSAIKRFVPQ